MTAYVERRDGAVSNAALLEVRLISGRLNLGAVFRSEHF